MKARFTTSLSQSKTNDVYGVIGEDDSDTNTLKVLICRLADKPGLLVRTKSFDGCSGLLHRGAEQLRSFVILGCNRFVICHDADGPRQEPKHREVMQKIVRPFGVAEKCCVVIPVQEIEAWILADLEAVANVFKLWRPKPINSNPESIANPKEHLERLSRVKNKRPIYSHTIHNPMVAKHLDLAHVRRRCPSFDHLAKFVTGT